MQALDLFESFPQARLARGQIYLRAEEYDNARPDFNTAISQFQAKDSDNPAIFEAYMGNGLAFIGLGRPESAVTNFQLVARNQPENFQAFLYWGQALVLIGGNNNAEDALEPLTTALGLTQEEADSAQVFYWRARAYQILRRTAEEIADLTALAALDAKDLAPTAEARLTEIGPLSTATSEASPTAAASATTSGPTATPTRPSRTATRTPTPTRTP
jgi:tetratricopeptide (TPR) repeat protein